MLFSSLLFLFYYLPAVLLIYFLLPRKFRNFFLLVVSLIFYAWSEPLSLFIMLGVILVNYFCGMQIQKSLNGGNARRAKTVLIVGLVCDIAVLAFFKYTNFFLETANTLPGVSLEFMHIALPVGISFYIFHSMSYLTDIYRQDVRFQRSLINFAAYISLFPQLVAGPIVKYKDIHVQLTERRESFDQFGEGVRRFITGLAKKVLIANTIGVLWTQISTQDLDKLPALTAWIGILAFTFQIYFDFSGYSDMAIGLAKMFGFEFKENFNYPYVSQSITEFWRRWHISLSTWFRDYVYIPLGGNRKGLPRQIVNILVVWALTGIWHGASWNFVLWGLYFAALLILEKMVLLRVLPKIPAFFRHLYALVFIVLGWVLFAFDDFREGFAFLEALFGLNGAGFADNGSLYLLTTNLILLAVAAVGSTEWPRRLVCRAETALSAKKSAVPAALPTVGACVILLAYGVFSVAYLVDASYNPFLYFRF